MGGTVSKSRQKATTNVIAEAIYNEIKQFQNIVSIDQSQVTTGNAWMIGNSQYVQINFDVSTAASSSKLDDIGTSVANALSASTGAKGSGVSFGTYVSAESKADIINNVRQTVSKTSVLNNMNAINAKQSQIATGNSMMVFNSQSAAVDMVVQTIADSFDQTNLSAAIKSATKTETSAITENPLSFISDLISGLMEPFKALGWVVIGFIALIFIAIAYSVVGGGDDAPAAPYPYPPPSPYSSPPGQYPPPYGMPPPQYQPQYPAPMPPQYPAPMSPQYGMSPQYSQQMPQQMGPPASPSPYIV